MIQQQVDAEIKEKKASRLSVYFRGMTTGRWGGINEDEIYPGGSLIKVPFLVAYYKLAETHPDIFKEQLTYKGDFDETPGQFTKPSHTIEAGKSYSIEELLHRMIVYSGNNSTVLLMRRLDRYYLKSIFQDLQVPSAQSAHQQWLVSTQQFASFFRVLYGATYLDRTMSERALELLVQTEFADGIVAGVPPMIKVAHKFGEWVVADTAGHTVSAFLHDCGIVYHHANPYFLCVMSEGTSHDTLKGVIARLSKTIYEYVDSPEYPRIS